METDELFKNRIFWLNLMTYVFPYNKLYHLLQG